MISSDEKIAMVFASWFEMTLVPDQSDLCECLVTGYIRERQSATTFCGPGIYSHFVVVFLKLEAPSEESG
jgi:hypothetical protein